MRGFFIGFLLVISCPACAQTSGSRSVPKKSASKTYTSPDGSFQFTYPALLIHCERAEQKNGGGNWIQKECVAYFPTCDEGIGVDSKNTIACLAYPRNKHSDTGAFEAATFSVGAIDALKNRGTCLHPPLQQIERKKGQVVINGFTFTEYETGEGGMSQGVGARIYRGFHAGTCYELAIAEATADPEAFDPPERRLSKRDWAAVNGALEQARNSFRFLQ
jgi:hypothetical protein